MSVVVFALVGTMLITSMKPYDPEGRQGPSKNLPDAVSLVE